MNARGRRAVVAILVLASLGLSACGGGGDSQAAKVKAEIKASILKSEKGDAPSALRLDDAQAGCFASQLVDHVSVDGLKKDDVLTADGKVAKPLTAGGSLKLPAADAGTFVSALFDCTNGGGQVLTLFHEELTQHMSNLSAAAKTCIDTKIDAVLVRKILIATLSGQDTSPVAAQIAQITEACVAAPS